MVNPGVKVEMKRPNVQRDKETVTQMRDVLEILFVDVTTAEIIIKMLHPVMTVALLRIIRRGLKAIEFSGLQQ